MSICDVLLRGQHVQVHRLHALQIVLLVLQLAQSGRLDAAEADHRRRALPLDASALAEAKENEGEDTDAEDEDEEEANGDDDARCGDGNQLTTLHGREGSHLNQEMHKQETGLISGMRKKGRVRCYEKLLMQ